jgi:hypothetical protein
LYYVSRAPSRSRRWRGPPAWPPASEPSQRQRRCVLMSRRLWTCAIVTTVSALVSAGFSVVGLFGPSSSGSFERYKMARPKRFELLTARFVVQKYLFAAFLNCTLESIDAASRHVCFEEEERTSTDRLAKSEKYHVWTDSNLAAVGANARGRNAAFPSWRPVLADQCKSQQGCLPTMRVQLHGCSSAQKFRARSHRYGSCG